MFARTFINWSSATLQARFSALAQVSLGQARSLLALAASQAAHDYELQRSRVANSGTVEAVAPLPGSPGHYVVVTRERTTATGSADYRGLPPAWHVTLAAVARVFGGLWVVSAWQPES